MSALRGRFGEGIQSRSAVSISAAVAIFVASWFVLGALGTAELSVAILALYFAVAGASFNFLYGMAGLFSIAQPVFLAVGGYTTVYLYNHFELSPWLSLLISVGLAGVLALPVGLIMLSREGTVLTALVTLVLAEALPPIVASVRSLGGASGLEENTVVGTDVWRMQFSSNLPFARIFLVMNLVVLIVILWFQRSKFGAWCAAMKDSPAAAEASGIATRRLRLSVFVASAMIAAPAGVVYAQYSLRTSTSMFLGITTLFQVVVVALVGGWVRPWGALVGSVVMNVLSYELTNAFPNRAGLSTFAFGIAFLLMAMVAPRGLSGAWMSFRSRWDAPRGGSPNGLGGGTRPDQQNKVDAGVRLGSQPRRST